MKKRNPSFGYLRIAMQIKGTFGMTIDKSIVKRILDKYIQLNTGNDGPSWLAFLGQMKDSLWSIDLFRCESILLKSHWVMVVMDQFSRKIIGFSVHAGDVDGTVLCCMFNKIIARKTLPIHLSTDNDPLFNFYRWKANLRILEINAIKSVAYIPISHPFVERLIGTIRRKFLDHTLFWNQNDLELKLNQFKNYYNDWRAHSSLGGVTPTQSCFKLEKNVMTIGSYGWKKLCGSLFQLPVAA